ncbi:MAG: SET domain-containing protein-lysine N-methyltransferase [Verrucomicrobiota bacterium]|nr:SET domain-containing protein-lysine N-methyltransferase [Verrucomicrobiota bacterium]
MSQAFLLPRGPYFLSKTEIKIPDELEPWRKRIDQLADRKLSWKKLFAELPEELEGDEDHPVLRVVSVKGGHNLLHLAVHQGEIEYVARLAGYRVLKRRRNEDGFTPVELAHYLNAQKILSLLDPTPRPTFFTARNITIENEEKFREKVFCEYLSHPIYESADDFDLLLAKTKKAKLSDAISSEKIWMGVYFDKEMQQHLHPKISLRWISEELGFGAFAEQRIPPCTFVGEYAGVVRERKKKIVKDNDYCVRYTLWNVGRKKFIIDANEQGNFTRFINHSFRPNLGLQSIYWRGLPRMIFISLKEIAPGDQLSFDYGTLFWKKSANAPLNLY